MLAAFGMVAGIQPATLMAQAPVPQTGTIWTGTIGTLPITACFESQYASEGVYYYNAHLIPLRLSSFDETAPGVLTEVPGSTSMTVRPGPSKAAVTRRFLASGATARAAIRSG